MRIKLETVFFLVKLGIVLQQLKLPSRLSNAAKISVL